MKFEALEGDCPPTVNMNLDTLIEAAKFVELQQVPAQLSSNHVDYGAPGPVPTPQEEKQVEPPVPQVPQETSTNIVPSRSPPILLEKRVLQSAMWVKNSDFLRDEDLQDFRRRSGIGTREVHNKLEKNRRAHLKECFELVKRQLPPNPDDKKPSNLNILHSAIKYIQNLRRKDKEHEHEMEKLAREKISLQQKLANLKKELSAQWDHIDFNTLVSEPSTSEHEEIAGTSDMEETAQSRSVDYSSTSSLSSSATASTSPTGPSNSSPNMTATPSQPPDTAQSESRTYTSPTIPTNSPQLPSAEEMPARSISNEDIPADGPKLISFTNHLETTTKRQITNSTENRVSSPHFQLPITNAATGQISATIVSTPTIQLVSPSDFRILPGEPPMAFSISQTNTNSGGLSLMQKSDAEEAVNMMHSNGVLTIPSGAFQGKNGVIYKPQQQGGNNLVPTHLTPGFTHVVTPIAGSHGTLVTPVPVTVVSQGNQVAHIISAPQGKVVAPVSIKPVISQYLVKPGAAMVVVTQSSPVSSNNS